MKCDDTALRSASPDERFRAYPRSRIAALPRDRAARGGHAAPRRPAHDVLGGMRQRRRRAAACSSTAVPAAAACRTTGASTIPSFWRIVLYDQRGAGRSTPVAELRRQHDRASGRRHRAAARASRHRRWLLFGGSWGSTLALPYAQAHPDRVLGPRAARRLSRDRRRDRLVHARHAHVFPEAWRAFARFLPPDERGDLLGNYYRRLTIADPAVHAARGARVGPLRRRVLDAAAEAERRRAPRRRRGALAIARIEAHYFVNAAFLEPTARCSRTSRGSVTCRARSSRAATTSSARRSPPMHSRARGPRPSTSSCPTPATRCASPASRASSSPPCSGCRTAFEVNATRGNAGR